MQIEKNNYFFKKKVLVTGGTGMIGMELTKMLILLGAKVSVVSLDKIKYFNKVKYYRKDLRIYENCLAVCKNKDIVFHLAGIKGSPKMAKEKPASFLVPTILFSLNMLEAARKCNVKKYLMTSSVGVYAPKKIFNEDDVWKSFPSENDRFPGWAKRICELQAEAYELEYKWKGISIVRPANVYGPFDNFNPDNSMVIPALIHKAINTKKTFLNVWGDGSPIRDFIYSEDVAKGMLKVIEKNFTKPINLGSGKGVSIKTIAEIISKNVPNGPLKLIWDKSKPNGDAKRLMNTKLSSKIGFFPETTIESGIKKTIDWYIKYGKLYESKRYNVFLDKK